METANTISPLHSFDAKVWADDFCTIAKKLGHDLDKDWMLGWFANALMRGWDEHARRNRDKLLSFEPGGAVERLVKNAVSEFHSRHKGKDDFKYYDAKGTTLLRTEDCQFCKAIAELEALLPKEGEAKDG